MTIPTDVLLNGDLSARFVDFDSVKSDIEDKADIFARDALIDPKVYREFTLSGEYYNLNSIKRFSKQAKVPYWIIIGRLQKDEWIDRSTFASEIPSYEKIA